MSDAQSDITSGRYFYPQKHPDIVLTKKELDDLHGDRDALKAEVELLREALSRLRSLYLLDMHREFTDAEMAKRLADADAALARQSKAAERWAAMQRVCEVAEDHRRIEYPRELTEALDALTALEQRASNKDA